MSEYTLPPVNVVFGAQGVSDVLDAFSTIERRAADLEKRLARMKGGLGGRGGKTEDEKAADRASRAAEKAAQAKEKADARAAKSAEKAADQRVKAEQRANTKAEKDAERSAKRKADAEIREGRRAAREHQQHQQRLNRSIGSAFGGSAGGEFMGGLRGGAGFGAAMGGVMVLKGAIDMAADALKQFGSWVLHEVIRPELALQTRAQQMSNKTGGEKSGAEIQGANRAMALQFGMDPTETMAVLSNAIDKFGDITKAMQVTKMSLGLSKAYGVPADVASSFLGLERSKLSGLDDRTFEGLVNAYAGKILGKQSGISFGALANLQGEATSSAELLGGDKAQAHLASVGLLAYGSKFAASPAEAAVGMRTLFEDLRKHDRAKSVDAATDQIKSPDTVLASFVTRMGGSSQRLKAMEFSDPATRFLEPMMNMWREAEAAKKGSGEKTVQDFVKGLITPEAGASRSIIDEGANRTSQTPEQQLNMAVAKLKDSLLPLVPAAEKVIAALVALEPEIETLIDDYILPWGDSLGESTGLLDLIVPSIRAVIVIFDVLKAYAALLISPFSLLAYGIAKVLAMIPGTGVTDADADKVWDTLIAHPLKAPVEDVDKWARASAEKDAGVPAHMRHARLAHEVGNGVRLNPIISGAKPTPTSDTMPANPAALQGFLDADAAAGRFAKKLDNFDITKDPLPRNTPYSDPYRVTP